MPFMPDGQTCQHVSGTAAPLVPDGHTCQPGSLGCHDCRNNPVMITMVASLHSQMTMMASNSGSTRGGGVGGDRWHSRCSHPRSKGSINANMNDHAGSALIGIGRLVGPAAWVFLVSGVWDPEGPGGG